MAGLKAVLEQGSQKTRIIILVVFSVQDSGGLMGPAPPPRGGGSRGRGPGNLHLATTWFVMHAAAECFVNSAMLYILFCEHIAALVGLESLAKI